MTANISAGLNGYGYQCVCARALRTGPAGPLATALYYVYQVHAHCKNRRYFYSFWSIQLPGTLLSHAQFSNFGCVKLKFLFTDGLENYPLAIYVHCLECRGYSNNSLV